MSYTHLQVHSGYSLLDSAVTIDKLTKKASDLQFEALALTDHEVLYGVIPFYKSCLKYNIKPIVGMTLNILNINNELEYCILLAKNNDGYKQLIKISTMIKKDQKSLSLKEIHLYTGNLICILPVQSSTLENLFMNNSFEEAKKQIDHWINCFHHDFYLGIQDHGVASERKLQLQIKAFHEMYHVPVVAINDVRYIEKDDYVAFDCLQAMKDHNRWTPSNIHPSVQNRHLRSSEEMKLIYDDFWPEPFNNTKVIQQTCNVTFELNKTLLPTYPTPNDVSAHKYLEQLCWESVGEKYHKVTKDVRKRLTYELEVIQSMGFSDYFLIVWDFVQYAKNSNILVGPGRGSAAGSIVAFILGITEVDPLKYNLLFERFLNPERISMPDIDIDFADDRRDEVIQYVREKYGETHVAQIATFGTFGARSLLRELFKTMGIDQQDSYYILNFIPSHTSQSITDSIKKSRELKDYIKNSKKLKLLFKIAIILEGLPRHISTHAAGVVISEKPLTNHVPLTKGTNETNLTQFQMDDLEAIGLLKMDFLGLRNLTFIDQILKSISYRTNQSLSIDHIPTEDRKTFKLLQEGRTNGIFQLESQGMRQVLRKLRPTNFEDIVAVNALYRPGPMDYIDTYIERKASNEDVHYIHSELKSILEKTYGVLIYQEQIMQITHKIAGFSLGEADILRRAISKKSSSIINDQKQAFVNGCIKNGYDQKVAEEIFLWIKRFSNYGFNRSHAVAYSKISYQLAYLKANYPKDFLAELLSSVGNQKEKVSQYIKEAKDLNIEVLPPSINKSFGKYSVESGSIRMGLLSVKGIGYQMIKSIIETRKQGVFTSLFDFCLRMPANHVNRKMLEPLILSGAFDDIYSNRASLLASIDQAIEQGELFRGFDQQPSFLTESLGIKENYTDVEDFSTMKKLSDEKELLGVYVSSHPLKEYRKKLRLNGFYSIANAHHLMGQKNIRSAVVIQSIKKIRTKRGDPMAFLVIGDETGTMEAVVFPELYRQENRWLKEEAIVFISGKIERRNNNLQWLLSTIEPFDKASLLETNERLFIKITDDQNKQALDVLRDFSLKYPGTTPVYIHDKKSGKTYRLSEQYNILPNSKNLTKLMNYFGTDCVVLDNKK